MRNLLLVVLAGFLAMVGLSSPAEASGSSFYVGRTTAITKFEDCRDYAFHYDVPDDVLAQAAGWSLDVTFYDPVGLQSTSDFVYDDANPSSGTVNAYICGYESAGRWSLKGELSWYDGDYNEHTEVTSSTFSVLKSPTKTALTVNDSTARYGQTLTFRATATRLFPNGWFGDRYATIRLQKYVGGAWRTIASKQADVYGKARFSVVWKHRSAVKVRAVRMTTTGSSGSVSATRTIY